MDGAPPIVSRHVREGCDDAPPKGQEPFGDAGLTLTQVAHEVGAGHVVERHVGVGLVHEYRDRLEVTCPKGVGPVGVAHLVGRVGKALGSRDLLYVARLVCPSRERELALQRGVQILRLCERVHDDLG